jgi:hypothetical protein
MRRIEEASRKPSGERKKERMEEWEKSHRMLHVYLG